MHPVGSGGTHVLVYFVEDRSGPLGEELGRLRHDRHDRNVALAARLAELGLPVTYEEAVAEAGSEEGVGRPHFAAALVRKGVVDDINEAFNRYLGNGRPAYIPKSRLTAADVARLATASGGVAALAHPFSTGLDLPGSRRAGGRAGRRRLRRHRGRLRPLHPAPAPRPDVAGTPARPGGHGRVRPPRQHQARPDGRHRHGGPQGARPGARRARRPAPGRPPARRRPPAIWSRPGPAGRDALSW